uniref:right-handed parallel beta-helix repeat-containing protein n=1 Tax=Bradyrhizobium sp. WSM1743 TaxID=318996 RepID=UPI0018DCE24C
TIKNCIVQNFTNWGILDTNDALNTRVENCTIDGTGSHGTTGLGVGGGTNSAIIGCDIKGMAIAINMFGSALVKDNYIHDLNDTSSDPAARHFDGIRAMVSGADIEHNTIMMPDRDGGTAAVFINTEYPDAPGPIDNLQVKNRPRLSATMSNGITKRAPPRTQKDDRPFASHRRGGAGQLLRRRQRHPLRHRTQLPPHSRLAEE